MDREHIYRRAEELASSGFCAGPAEVIAKIVAEGYPQADSILNTDLIRKDLRRQCEAAAAELGPTRLWNLDSRRR